MQQLILVLVGAIGIGLGIGAALFVPRGEEVSQTASAASGFEMFEDGDEEEGAEGASEEASSARELFEVVKVIDGDTVTLKIGEKNETVRLIGIDTPETNDTRTGVECFGAEATAYLKKIIGKRVAIEKDAGQGERDKYDRMLGYLFAENGVHLNKKMIEEGYAYEYTYDDAYKYQKEYKASEASAKEAGRGLWAADACPPTVQAGPQPAAVVPKVVAPISPVVVPVGDPVPKLEPEPVEMTEEAAPKQEDPKPEPEPEEKTQTPAPSGQYTCSSNAYNCSHFKTQAEAQAAFEQCGGVDNDVHRLDGNKDGEVCESLP